MVNVIDYMPGDTLLHRLNPVVKLGLAAAIIVGIFLSDTYVALLGFLALTLALGAYAGVVDRLFSLLKLLIPLALIMLVLHVPYRYAFTFTTALRFVPVFGQEMNAIMEAQTARGVEFDGGVLKKVRLMMPLCVPLLVSSVRKTNSAAIAAEVRGFDLRTRESGFKEYPFAGIDFAALAVAVAIAAAAIALGVLL